MWNWTCPRQPNYVREHHTLAGLEELLETHERGINVPGGIQFPGIPSTPPCNEMHDYWDDGIPCHRGPGKKGKGCNLRYIPDPNGPDEFVD